MHGEGFGAGWRWANLPEGRKEPDEERSDRCPPGPGDRYRQSFGASPHSAGVYPRAATGHSITGVRLKHVLIVIHSEAQRE